MTHGVILGRKSQEFNVEVRSVSPSAEDMTAIRNWQATSFS